MSTLSETLYKTLPNLCGFILGLLPFIIGFIFMAQTLFW